MACLCLGASSFRPQQLSFPLIVPPSFCYVWLCIPEVKGLTLEEVDQLYRENVKPWRSASWRPTLLDQVHHEDMSEKPGEVRKENAS